MTSRKKRGRFITFEGIDGSGKTTQIGRLARVLRRRGIPIVITREPGGTPIADRIREILLSSKSTGMQPTTEVLLYFASRAENVARVIRPALEAGKIVLCDRYTDASMAYQGYGRRLGTTIVRRLHEFACQDVNPDLTLVLEIDPQTSVERARRRNTRHRRDEGRLEQETLDFYRRVRRGYHNLARREPHRVKLLEGEAPPAVVHETILKAVEPLIRRYKKSKSKSQTHKTQRRVR